MSTLAFLLGCTELLAGVAIISRYSDFWNEEPEDFLSKAPITEIVRVQGHMVSAVMMWNFAGILWWLPR